MYKPLLLCGPFSRCLSVPLSVPQGELMLHTQTAQVGRNRSVTTASQRPTITNKKLSQQLSQTFFSLSKFKCYWYDIICQNVKGWVQRPCTCTNFMISFAFNKMTHGTSEFSYPYLPSLCTNQSTVHTKMFQSNRYPNGKRINWHVKPRFDNIKTIDLLMPDWPWPSSSFCINWSPSAWSTLTL